MTPPITALGSRYGIQGALGRSVKRAAAGGGWWDLNGTITSCVAAYQPKGAASYAASLTDLSGNSNDATATNAPDWSESVGWNFIKANSDFIRIPTLPVDTHSATIAVRYGGVTEGSYWFGSTEFPNNGYWNAAEARWYGGIGVGISNIASTIVAIADSGNWKVYQNGTLKGTASNITSATGNTTNWSLGTIRSMTNYVSSLTVQAWAYYTSPLTVEQAEALYTAMAAL